MQMQRLYVHTTDMTLRYTLPPFLLGSPPFLLGNYSPPFLLGNYSPPFLLGNYSPPFLLGNYLPPFLLGNICLPSFGNYSPPFLLGNYLPPFLLGNYLPPFLLGNYSPPFLLGNYLPPFLLGNICLPSFGNYSPLFLLGNYLPEDITTFHSLARSLQPTAPGHTPIHHPLLTFGEGDHKLMMSSQVSIGLGPRIPSFHWIRTKFPFKNPKFRTKNSFQPGLNINLYKFHRNHPQDLGPRFWGVRSLPHPPNIILPQTLAQP